MSATQVDRLLPAPKWRRVVQLLAGLVLFAVSLALLIDADLGLDPWDVFHQGLARTFNVRLGTVVVVASLAVLALWMPLRQRPGLGTALNAVLVGAVFEAATPVVDVLLGDVESTFARWATFAAAVALNAVATGMYVGAGLGPGPRDGLMTGIARRGHSIRAVRTSIEIWVLAVGWLLGGSVGVGTVVFAASIGPLVSLKNALDCLYWEWANKPVGFVSYSGGGSGGIRAVEMTRQVALTLSMLPLNEMVNLADVDSLIADGTLNPPEGATDMLHGLADSLANHLDASRLLRSR